MMKVDLIFKKLLDTIKHPLLALDHSKAHPFLLGTLTSIEEMFLIWLVKLMKMHIMLNMYSYWTKWCDFVKNELSWKTFLAMPSSLISFCLGATFGTLPSPSNLKCWRLITDSSCFLYGKIICTSAHILGACKIVLHQGQFSFRHDKVLCELAVILKNFLSSYMPNKSSDINFINFDREGKNPKIALRKGFLGILHSAYDWKLKFDLDGMLVVPVF